MFNTNQNKMTELSALNFYCNTYNRKKFINVGELTGTFNKTELERLNHYGVTTTINLNKSLVGGVHNEFNMTQMDVIKMVAFIESQLIFVRRAIKHFETNFDCVTIEGTVLDFELCQN
jgi:hypothetical protein